MITLIIFQGLMACRMKISFLADCDHECTQVSQSRFNPKSAPREDLGAVLKPNIEPKLDEYYLYFFQSPTSEAPGGPRKSGFSVFFSNFQYTFFFKKFFIKGGLRGKVLKPLGMALVGIYAGLEGILDLEPNSNT